MRELRAVRVSDDGKELLLAETSDATQAGSTEAVFVLRADDRLRTMLRPRPIATDTRPESALSPREIQSRLRAGETAEDVARAAGIPVARVARYEAPIAAERVRIVDEVRRATAPGPHRVSAGRQLGALVDERLTDEGYDPALALWLARRRPDGTWLVTVDLADHHAEWSWDSAARRVRAQDGGAHRMVSPTRSSSDALIAVAQAAGVTTGASDPRSLAPARAVGESMAPSSDSSATRSTASSRSGLVVLPGEGGGEPPAPVRSQGSAPSALTDVPGAGAPVTQTAAAPAASSWAASAADVPGSGGPGTGTASKATEPSASASDAPEVDAVELAEEPAARQSKSGRRRSAVPAWDDIVFGARRS